MNKSVFTKNLCYRFISSIVIILISVFTINVNCQIQLCLNSNVELYLIASSQVLNLEKVNFNDTSNVFFKANNSIENKKLISADYNNKIIQDSQVIDIENSDNYHLSTLPPFSSGSIQTTGQSICSGGDPSIIGSSIDASGGDNNITYKWQANGVDVVGSNSANYNPPIGLTMTTTYTRWAKDGTTAFYTISGGSWVVSVTNPGVVTSLISNDFVWNGITNSSWNVTSNWLQWNGSSYIVPSSYPNASTANVILPSVSACVFNSVSIPTGTFATNNITVESGQTLFLSSATSILNIAGTFTVDGTWSTPTSGSIVCFNSSGNQTIPALSYSKLQTANGGIKELNGDVTANNVVTIGSLSELNLGSHSLNLSFIGTPFVVSGTFTSSTGTVNFNGAGAQNIPSLTYYHLQTSTSGTKTLAIGTTTVNGILTINSGSIFSQGTGRTLNLNFSGVPIVNNGTFAALTSTTVFNATGAQTIPVLTYYDFQTSGTGTKTLAGSTTVINNVLTIGSGTTFSTSSYTLRLSKIGSGIIVNNGIWDNSTGTVDFRIAGDQVIPPMTYYNLRTNNGGVKTLSGTTTVTNLLTIGASTTFQLDTYTLNLVKLNSATITNFGNFEAGTGTVVLSANGSQLISGLNYYNLVLNSTGTKTLSGNASVFGDLTLTSGTLAIGSNTLTYGGGSITRTAGIINASSLNANITFTNTIALDLPSSLFSGSITNLTLNGAGGINLDGALTISNSIDLVNGVMTIGANTLNFNGSTLTRTTGSIDASNPSALLNFGNSSSLSLPSNVFSGTINDINILGTGGISLNSDLTLTGDLNMIGGSLFLEASNLTVEINATITRTSGNVNTGTGGLVYKASSLNMDNFVSNTIDHIEINRLGGTVILNGDLIITSDFILTEGIFDIGSNSLTLNGSIEHTSGSIDADVGTINFNYSSPLTLPIGFFNGNVYRVGLSGGNLVLSESVTITNLLTLTNGIINVGDANTLEIGTSKSNPGLISWTAGTVTGPLKRWFAASTNSSQASGIFPVGTIEYNKYAQINFTETTPGGYIIIKYVEGTPSNAYAGLPFSFTENSSSKLIQNADDEGYWEMTPYSESGVAYGALDDKTYDLFLRINNPHSVQQGGVLGNPPGIRLIRAKGHPDGSHENWTLAGTYTATTTYSEGEDYKVGAGGVVGFSWFNGGGNNENPLPVELLSFNGSCENNTIELKWETASEYNSNYFEILKSINGENWTSIAKLNAAGISNSLLNYSLKDQIKSETTSYYKLIQFDTDGYSKTYNSVIVNCENESESLISYPNPSSTEVSLVIVSNKSKKVQLEITDNNGRILFSENKSLNLGTTLIDLSGLIQQPGVYVIKVIDEFGLLKTIKHFQL
jgi:hypothetical protein